MADSITTFSADASRQIAQAVRDFQRRPMHPAQLDTDWAGGEAREIRWGRTTTSLEYPSYPSSGGAYVCELGDYTHSGIPSVTPTKTFTAYSPKSTVVAVDPTGATWAENTVVRLERHEGEWWIRPAGATNYWCFTRSTTSVEMVQYSTHELLASGSYTDGMASGNAATFQSGRLSMTQAGTYFVHARVTFRFDYESPFVARDFFARIYANNGSGGYVEGYVQGFEKSGTSIKTTGHAVGILDGVTAGQTIYLYTQPDGSNYPPSGYLYADSWLMTLIKMPSAMVP